MVTSSERSGKKVSSVPTALPFNTTHLVLAKALWQEALGKEKPNSSELHARWKNERKEYLKTARRVIGRIVRATGKSAIS